MANLNMEFQFVNSTISCPTVPRDLAVRSMIRKQAMKQASAARKRTGNYGKHNLRQYPIFLYEQELVKVDPMSKLKVCEVDVQDVDHQAATLTCNNITSNIKTKRVPSRIKSKGNPPTKDKFVGTLVVFPEAIPRGPSAQRFELTCAKANFDILLLSSLATLHVCRPVRQLLSQSPNRLVGQLQAYRRPSYFRYIPSRYDDVPCLRDAIDCVIARTQQIISPDPTTERQALKTYVKALGSLQAALDDLEQWLQPEVLCATEILALYEVGFRLGFYCFTR